VLGLEAGTAYTFTVRAKNVLGYGVYSAASASATTATTATQATTTSTPTPAPTAVLAITGVQWPFALVLGISSLALIGLGATMFGYRRANRRFSNY
jgi:hypothetical protein